jgi:hypothetical protein
MIMITQSDVQAVLEYKDGFLYSKKTGRSSLYKDAKGYMQIGIGGKRYLQHRIIYLLFHGYLPSVVDHIDGDTTNNRIENLRAATNTENLQNMKLCPSNTSGGKNISWDKKANKWLVMFRVNGANKYLGLFKDFEFADLVASEARHKFHGQFARHA